MSSSVSTLLACLEKETDLVARFIAVLQDEARVLEDGAVEAALIETTERRNTLTDALLETAAQRNAELAALGFSSDGAGLEAAVQAHPELAPAKEALLRHTEEARALNESNGRIIEVFLDHTKRSVEILRRLTGMGDIYDASGRKRPTGASMSRNIKAG